MKKYEIKSRDFQKKRKRFRRPEFQQKLEKARRFARKPKEQPKNKSAKILITVGLQSKLGRLLFGLLGLLIVYYLAISPFFLVRAGSISGFSLDTTQIEDFFSRVESERSFFIPKNHILIFDHDSFTAELKREFPDVRDVSTYKRVLPNKVLATVEVRQQKFVWQTGNDYYFMDQGGVLFQKISNFDPTIYQQLLIRDSTSQPVLVGEDLEIPKILTFLEGIESAWQETVVGISVSSLSLPGTASVDIIVQTDLGFEVFFDLNRGARGQLENLQLLLAQEVNPETVTGLKYIDLRLANVGYYCYRDAPCAGEVFIEEDEETNLEEEL